jgi:hypothetical protein
MKEAILLEVRPFLFPHAISKVSGMLDQYRTQIEKTLLDQKTTTKDTELLKDQIKHLLRALSMIAEVPETSAGAIMAKGIAAEAVSTLR